MKGSLSQDVEAIGVPAGDVWEVYRSIRLTQLVVQLLPHIFQNISVEEGDGGVGTVLKLTFASGTPGPQSYKEKFVKIDDKERVKEAIVVEGGYLSIGFQSYLVRFEILESSNGSTIIRSTIEYDIDYEYIEKASAVTICPLVDIAEVITKHLVEKK